MENLESIYFSPKYRPLHKFIKYLLMKGLDNVQARVQKANYKSI